MSMSTTVKSPAEEISYGKMYASIPTARANSGISGSQSTYRYFVYSSAEEYYGSQELKMEGESYWSIKMLTGMMKKNNLPVLSVYMGCGGVGGAVETSRFNVSDFDILSDVMNDVGAVVFQGAKKEYCWNASSHVPRDVREQFVVSSEIRNTMKQNNRPLSTKTRLIAARLPLQMFLQVPLHKIFGSALREIVYMSIYDPETWSAPGRTNRSIIDWSWIKQNVIRKLEVATTRGLKLVRKLDLSELGLVRQEDLMEETEWALFPKSYTLSYSNSIKRPLRIVRLRHKREDLTLCLTYYVPPAAEGEQQDEGGRLFRKTFFLQPRKLRRHTVPVSHLSRGAAPSLSKETVEYDGEDTTEDEEEEEEEEKGYGVSKPSEEGHVKFIKKNVKDKGTCCLH